MMRNIRKWICLLLVLALLVPYLPAETFAQTVQEGSTFTFSTTHVNPLYQGLNSTVVSDKLLSSGATTTEETSTEENAEYLETVQAFGEALSWGMVDRESKIGFYSQLPADQFEASQESVDALVQGMLEVAFVHQPGDPKYGDSLRWAYDKCEVDVDVNYTGEVCDLNLTLQVDYYTNAEQEAQLDAAVAELLESFQFTEQTSDYEKVQSVYDYVCNNVKYDYDNLEDDSYCLKYTAYAALLNGTSVCQGYAVLLYRLLLELGIDCRVIAGYGEGERHAWNIVRLDGLYYNADATWDAVMAEYDMDYVYFLLPDAEFDEHTRDAEYLTEAFYESYPMGAGPYEPSGEEKLAYQVNGDGETCTITGLGTCTAAELTIPETIDGYAVTAIGESAFSGCDSLIHVSIPSSVTNIGECAFAESSLVSVVISEGVTSLGWGVFSDCANLVSVKLPDSLTSMDGFVFHGCSSLKSITIPDGVTALGRHTFDGCTSLTDVVLPDTLETIGERSFERCSSLVSIDLPDKLKSISFSLFCRCSSLESITIPDSVTLIDSGAFSGCTSLTSIVIPDTVTGIGDNAFNGCTNLTTIKLSDKLWGILDFAFSGCTSLTSIVIPDSVTIIYEAAFEFCTELTEIVFEGDAPEFTDGAFWDVTATVYYPAGNETWTEAVMQNYGGTLTWVAVGGGGEEEEHTCTEFEEVAEVPADCYTDGVKAHDKCISCGKLYLNGEEVTAEALVIPTDSHDLVHVDGVEPGCHFTGNIEHWYCADCETVWADEDLTQITNHKNVIIPALGGDVIHFAARQATCTEDGNIEYWYCEECEQFWLNGDLTQLATSKDVLLPATGHSVCHVEGIEPGCHYDGHIEYWYCMTCEMVWKDENLTQLTNFRLVILPATGGDVIHFAAKQATCTENGNIEYWYCEQCEQFWLNGDLTQLATSKDVLLPATGHNYVDGVCSGCGEKELLLGDADGDGEIDSSDARVLMRYAVGLIGEDEINLAAADVNGDGKINSRDARLILRFELGLITQFPSQKEFG